MEQILPGLIIGVAVAISGAFVSHLFIRNREKERWEREDRRQRETREHEWLLRHRDDRLELYRRLLSDLSQIEAETDSPDGVTWEKATHTARETELLGSPAVRETARALLLAKVNHEHFRSRIMSGELTEDAEVKKELDRHNKDLDEANRRFINAAREELGIDTLF
jgi:hypothetical protein